MQKHRNIPLDLVRGISILLIIFFHYNCTVRTFSNDLVLFKYYRYAANIGVSMFFILSGASLTLSQRNNFSVLEFYKKRFIAIFPLFWSIYIIIVFVRTILFHSNPFVGKNPLTFILTILGIDGFLLYKIPNYYVIGEWFLGCIIIIYLIYPILRFFFYKNRHLLLIISLLTCLILQQVYCLDMNILRFPLFRIFEFVFGMYFMHYIIEINTETFAYNFKLLFASILGILAIFLLELNSNLFVSNAILGILSFVFLMTVGSIFEMYLPRHLIYFLSKYSYTAFLIHHIMLFKFIVYVHRRYVGLITDYKYLFFFGLLCLIYLLSLIIYSSLRALFRNSIPIL